MSPLSPALSHLLVWSLMSVVAAVAWWATRPKPEDDFMADLWPTYRHHWTDDEGEAA